jgi:hypothetical protein
MDVSSKVGGVPGSLSGRLQNALGGQQPCHVQGAAGGAVAALFRGDFEPVASLELRVSPQAATSSNNARASV